MSLRTSIAAGAFQLLRALRYELSRLRGLHAVRSVAVFSILVSALLTLPAARHIVGLDHPTPPSPHPHPLPTTIPALRALATPLRVPSLSTLLHQYTPTHGGGAWVVAGGIAGMVLPGIAAAFGAGWFGATSISYEYRYGGGLLAYTLLPRRSTVLVAKAVVAAVFGVVLCFVTTAAAYGTAWLGFRLAGTHVDLPATLMVPAERAVGLAALAGVFGVLGGVVFRLRAVAGLVALGGCALVAMFLPGSMSVAGPYLARGARYVVRMTPGVTYATVLDLALGVPLVALALAGVVAVRRRRVV